MTNKQLLARNSELERTLAIATSLMESFRAGLARQIASQTAPVDQWLTKCAIIDGAARWSRTEAAASWSEWCAENGVKATSPMRLYAELEARGLRSVQTHGKRYIQGLRQRGL